MRFPLCSLLFLPLMSGCAEKFSRTDNEARVLRAIAGESVPVTQATPALAPEFLAVTTTEVANLDEPTAKALLVAIADFADWHPLRDQRFETRFRIKRLPDGWRISALRMVRERGAQHLLPNVPSIEVNHQYQIVRRVAGS